MEIEDAALKKWGIGIGLGVVLLAGIDMVALEGQHVTSGSADLRDDSPPLVLRIDRAGEEHLVEISTRRRKHGETVGQTIAYRLTGPDGTVVHQDSELVNHKKRFFDFVPTEPGDYLFEAEENRLVGGGRGSASVRVTVGDRRILSRWLRF